MRNGALVICDARLGVIRSDDVRSLPFSLVVAVFFFFLSFFNDVPTARATARNYISFLSARARRSISRRLTNESN